MPKTASEVKSAVNAGVTPAEVVAEELPMTPLVFLSYVILAAVTLTANYVSIPVHVQLLLSATLPIYIASHNSLGMKATEVMESGDAWKAPLFGSAALFGLYIVFTLLDPYWPNMLLRAYFMFAGVIALQLTIRRFVDPVFKMAGLDGAQRKVDFNEPYVIGEVKMDFNNSDVLAMALSLGAGAWYLQTGHWWGNNMFGMAFCIQAIENVSLGKYVTGAILLSGLFLYDIFWVFGTDVMVTVAMSFDAPIKLMFPRLSTEPDTSMQFSILGLGDIVIPGIFIALLLRYDHSRHVERAGDDDVVLAAVDFDKPVFNATILSYVLGLVTTVLVMYAFEAAQPALLYLVPFTIGASFLTAVATGQTTALLAYSEEEEQQEEGADDGDGNGDGDGDGSDKDKAAENNKKKKKKEKTDKSKTE